MSHHKLDKEEQDILDAYEAEEFQSDLTEERRNLLAEAAEATIRKDKRINIRISGRDLSALQRKALEQGLPYQTLVTSILHKYASGSLRDLSSQRDTSADEAVEDLP
jgi:predicted DNA binding CopG/RHH family protein